MAGPLKIDWEPLDAPGLDDASDRAAWASLSITMDGAEDGPIVLTSNLDRRSKTTRQSVFGSVLPLAEWFVRSWSHLFHSRRVPAGTSPGSSMEYQWERTHCLRFVGDGMALPDLTFVPDDAGATRLVWNVDSDPDIARYSPVQFLTEGDHRVGTPDLVNSCASFVDSVLRRLSALAPDHPLTSELARRWQMVADPRAPGHEAERLSALAGLLWDELDEQKRERLERLSAGGVDIVTECLLHISDESDLEDWADRSRKTWQYCVSSANPVSQSWTELRDRIRTIPGGSTMGDPPWACGWEAARRYRTAIGMDEEQRPEADVLDGSFGMEDVDLPLPANETLLAWHSGRSPVRARCRGSGLTPRREAFLQARDLYPLLFESDPTRDYATMVSYRVAGVTSIANAFAAELLAPVALLRHKLASMSAIDTNGVGDLASEIDAPFGCVLHQIDNHGLAIIADRPCPPNRRSR